MKLMFLGAPATGKSTQGAMTAKKFSIPLISTGAMLRQEIKEKSEIGKKAESFIQKGDLVPDDLVISMVAKRLFEKDCENGFLLDGFPRTQSQAKALEEMGIILDMVISIEAAEDLLVARMTGRRICKDCAQTFDQASNPPQKEGVCDKCGGELIARSDDRSEVVRERLKVYAERTAPLKDYYRSKGVYQEVESRGTVEETFARIVKAIEKGES